MALPSTECAVDLQSTRCSDAINRQKKRIAHVCTIVIHTVIRLMKNASHSAPFKDPHRMQPNSKLRFCLSLSCSLVRWQLVETRTVSDHGNAPLTLSSAAAAAAATATPTTTVDPVSRCTCCTCCCRCLLPAEFDDIVASGRAIYILLRNVSRKNDVCARRWR